MRILSIQIVFLSQRYSVILVQPIEFKILSFSCMDQYTPSQILKKKYSNDLINIIIFVNNSFLLKAKIIALNQIQQNFLEAFKLFFYLSSKVIKVFGVSNYQYFFFEAQSV
ncbi:hypothetical protein TTHERM_00481200 (macronuclear) [Tetrahymena thermophila SB210]|uniref:Uncharacterized protein n=1 Tax=Tetrahymena thermophila (strain SB210) TaxID=312017 RepID=I7MEM2_TETTS|nr:hypothetical protein TTHERM_00481200 [Tetrahymena thermophila SB210]EAR97186.1 hypothetical protein TTHERM_00481200 [Tetrahymena thermophila SB210]|eukprot:XP_001017431.1 hypothetical protein TTHERM_00481200 [Tetrahymena thermophila SB210]